MGLAVLKASANQDKALMEESFESPIKQMNETIKTKLLTLPVRSGQQVVSKGGDLVITAAVSHGAELLADGNIHVYGALRGRALAGIAGDKQARIFCQSLDAELVSIAGYYCLSDVITPQAVPCQIYLQDDRIQIEPL
jgi:septum site-determining protein MinC